VGGRNGARGCMVRWFEGGVVTNGSAICSPRRRNGLKRLNVLRDAKGVGLVFSDSLNLRCAGRLPMGRNWFCSPSLAGEFLGVADVIEGGTMLIASLSCGVPGVPFLASGPVAINQKAYQGP
jgi:hypothetical protein